MTAQPGTGRRSRLRFATAVVGALVAVSGVCVAAPAEAAVAPAPCVSTPPDLARSVALPSSGVLDGLLDCTAGAQPGPTTPTDVPSSAPSAAPSVSPASAGPLGDDPAESGATGAPALSATSSSGSEAPVVMLRRSSAAVYPAKDGYLDTVRFSVRETGDDGLPVPLVGDAVLTRSGRTIRTWHLHGMSAVIAWNGRVGRAVHPGLYTLRVALTAPDGTVRSESTRVRVKAQHLVRRAMTIRTDVGAKSAVAEVPKQLLHAYRLGTVQVATRTVAVVRGPAELIFSGDGRRKAIPLRNGAHTTRPVVLPPGFARITITHDWAEGAARLKSLEAIWTYWTLV